MIDCNVLILTTVGKTMWENTISAENIIFLIEIITDNYQFLAFHLKFMKTAGTLAFLYFGAFFVREKTGYEGLKKG